MRMVFGQADEEEFYDAKERLVTKFAEWAEERSREVDPFVVDCALEFKWGYSDGRLGRWTTAAFRELLGEWFPRKVTLDESAWPAVVPTLHGWVDFLQHAGLRDQQGDGPSALHRELDDLAVDFTAAMADVTKYGMAKFWATTMAEHGVDVSDEEAVQRFITDLNEGRIGYEESALSAVLGNLDNLNNAAGDQVGQPEPSRMPPVRLAPETELAKGADENIAVQRLRALTQWAGDGRALTQTGRLKLADARQLVDLLGTSDVMDPVVGDRAVKTTSSAELYELDLTFQWAKAVRTVRVVKGRLVPVKKNAALLGRPLELWGRAFDEVANLGETICGRGYFQSLLTWDFELGYHAVLTALYTGGRLPRSELNDMVWELLCQAFWIDHGTQQQRWLWRKMVEADLRRLTDQLELLGAVRQVPEGEKTGLAEQSDVVADTGSAEAPPWLAGLEDDEHENDDELELTPLGVWGARRQLLGLGYAAPVIGDQAGESAEAAIAAAVEFGDVELTDEELAAWCAARGEEQAACELTALIRRTDEPRHRMLAFRALGYTGESGIAEIRTVRDDEDVGAYAGAWLVSREAADPSSLGRSEYALAMLETLAALRSLGPEAVVETFAEDATRENQLVMLDDLWRVRHPHLVPVLNAVAESHPDKTVAKAARKARFKAQSRST